MVECGGLENRCPRERTGGSNPSSSANHFKPDRQVGFFCLSQAEPSLLERGMWLIKKQLGAKRAIGFEMVGQLSPLWEKEVPAPTNPEKAIFLLFLSILLFGHFILLN